jgi:hypothetical protein
VNQGFEGGGGGGKEGGEKMYGKYNEVDSRKSFKFHIYEGVYRCCGMIL